MSAERYQKSLKRLPPSKKNQPYSIMKNWLLKFVSSVKSMNTRYNINIYITYTWNLLVLARVYARENRNYNVFIVKSGYNLVNVSKHQSFIVLLGLFSTTQVHCTVLDHQPMYLTTIHRPVSFVSARNTKGIASLPESTTSTWSSGMSTVTSDAFCYNVSKLIWGVVHGPEGPRSSAGSLWMADLSWRGQSRPSVVVHRVWSDCMKESSLMVLFLLGWTRKVKLNWHHTLARLFDGWTIMAQPTAILGWLKKSYALVRRKNTPIPCW